MENDLPERVVVCGIEEMQVEGMVSCKITDETSTVTIKVIDTNNDIGYFKYNIKTKNIDFIDNYNKSKEMER